MPAAAAFAGSTGTMIAVLANVITSAWGAVCTHLMRRDAPIRQRRATTWVDQSPILASCWACCSTSSGPRRAWTADVLTLAGPLLAFSGAALFTGSVIHPHNLARAPHRARPAPLDVVDGPTGRVLPGRRRRGGHLSVDAPRVVAVLSGLSAPSFQPIQLAVLYGYRCELVVAAVRWGWLLAPLGLGLAAVVR